ncbi:MAG: nucleoside 2-deoxyribosyltransferase [Bacteroidetes bacterium]|nr:nucleoside 2-deoxyribosyltransferase [Bacteroidota bacterium]
MTLNIIGGTYHEFCRDPYWDELYGSGLRAAHALSNSDVNIIYHTYSDSETFESLSVICNSINVQLNSQYIDRSASFIYEHPLAEPKIIHPMASVERNIIEADNVLLYGMLENIPIIKAKKIVYDPQSPKNPIPFSSLNSAANELIYILNEDEVYSLVRSTDEDKIRDYFFNSENAKAVIVKCGPKGAIIIQPDKSDIQIPLFKTNHVWPIGTGDVFSAVFALLYLVQGKSIQEAAIQASRATASYVETVSLPIAWEKLSNYNDTIIIKNDPPKKVYLAGPFFTMSQRWIIEQFRNALLKIGLEVFSPFHDVGIGGADEVVALDIKGIDESDGMVAILDGLDSGTLFEIGYAKAKNKPVFVFVENEKQQALTMLEGTDCIFEKDFSTIVYKTMWELYQ